MSQNKNIYRKDYYMYAELLSLGNIYYILISKRLLLKPILPIWLYLLCLFAVRNSVFFAMVGIPSLVVFSVSITMLFPVWNACNISIRAYITFHCVSILLIKIISIPFSMLLEVLWTLCF